MIKDMYIVYRVQAGTSATKRERQKVTPTGGTLGKDAASHSMNLAEIWMRGSGGGDRIQTSQFTKTLCAHETSKSAGENSLDHGYILNQRLYQCKLIIIYYIYAVEES